MTLKVEVMLRKGIPMKNLTIGDLKNIVSQLPIGASLIYDGDKKIFRLT